MEQQATGTVISVKKLWWLKINTKAARAHLLDGAVFPHIIKVSYAVNGQQYTKRKWLHPGQFVPEAGSTVQLIYSADKPSKARIL